MATAAATPPADRTSTSADESLWWDPFELLLLQLETAASPAPSSLVEKLDRYGEWWLKSVNMFKPPSQGSKSALDSGVVGLGTRRIEVRPELKELALELSRNALLDEVQSYIIVSRYVVQNKISVRVKDQNLRYRVLVHYYVERQCLLKCIRQIIVHSHGFESNDKISKVAQKLFSDGLEKLLLCTVEDLLSCKYFSFADADFITLSMEESLLETNLILDILFLAYYDTICTCKYEHWRSLCSIFKGMLSNSLRIGKLIVSVEDGSLLHLAKIQLLFILIETLNLDNLLYHINDGVPLRPDKYVFSGVDIQEINATLASFDISEAPEVGVLFVAWGVFHCLLSSLRDKHDNSVFEEIDHVTYVYQAFEVSPFTYLGGILDRNLLGESICSHLGYKSVIRTLVSAFMASYEIRYQPENETFHQLLDLLCKIYHKEESLCMQFWDHDSCLDGPIRRLLFELEGVFPFQYRELVSFLSELCEGDWAAECVYKFLDSVCGLTSLYEIPGVSSVESCPIFIETSHPYAFPGFEVLIIPSHTRGQVLKILDGNTVLVRWQHKQSGISILILSLAWNLHRCNYAELAVTLNLFHRLMSMNMALCFALLDVNYSVEPIAIDGFVQNTCFDFAQIVCSVISNVSVGDFNVGLMSTCISILSKLLQGSPLRISEVTQSLNSLYLDAGSTLSGFWMPPGRLAKLFLIDCEQIDGCCALTLAVLSFVRHLVEAGVEDEMAHSLLVFSLQYVLIDHGHWKFRMRHARWEVTLKALKLMKTCIDMIQDSKRLGLFVRNILLFDSSIHDTLFRIICVTASSLEELYVSSQYERKEIEGMQLAIVSVLDIVCSLLSKDYTTDMPAFHQALSSSSTKPMPILWAVMSLVSFARNPDIQIGAVRVLSMLCSISENIFLISNEAQIAELSSSIHKTISIHKIVSEDSISNEDLLIAMFQMLTSAAIYQPIFLLTIFSADSANTDETKQLHMESTSDSSKSTDNSLLSLLTEQLKMSDVLAHRSPPLLLNMLLFFRSLWRESSQYACIVKSLKASTNFWESILCILDNDSHKSSSFQKPKENWSICLAYKFQCQAAVLDIIAHDLFLHQKMSHSIKTEATIRSLPEKSVTSKHAAATENSNWFLEMDRQFFSDSSVEELVKLFVHCEFNKTVFDRLKTSICMVIVHFMLKLSGDVGCMPVSLVEDVRDAFKKLTEQPAFAELSMQYSYRGYSERDVSALVLSDLYYHLQGELEGRVAPGSFKALVTFLLCLDLFKKNDRTCTMEFLPPDGTSYLFDSKYIKRRIGLKSWEYSKLKTSKEAVENMLMHISGANDMVFCMDTKVSALKVLNSVLSIYLVSKRAPSLGQVVKEKFARLCVSLILKAMLAASELLIPPVDLLNNILNYLNEQAKLLLVFTSYLSRCNSGELTKHQFVPVFVDIIKVLSGVVKVLDGLKPCTPELRTTMKLLLFLLLTSFDFCLKSDVLNNAELVGANTFSNLSSESLGLLPILCYLAETAEYCNIAISTIDLILKNFWISSTWLPVLQKHLNLQDAVSKLQEKNPFISVSVTMKFFLTLATNQGGAELLQAVNIFSFLKHLFSQLLAEKSSASLSQLEAGHTFTSSCDEKVESIWGLGLAIVTAVIDSLTDFPFSADVAENLILFFFVERPDLISYHLSVPELPVDDQSKKRARSKNAPASLRVLMEIEYTIKLICTLAKHQTVWNRIMKGRDSILREQIIHLLAFISKEGLRFGGDPSKASSVMWLSGSEEQLDSLGRLQVGSRHGWFALSATSGEHTSLSPGVEVNQTVEPIKAPSKVRFSDSVALLMYKIAYFLLKFLCSQAEAAAKRAEDIGFIDLAHYPELPMPEILHGLQDQCMTIVSEVCMANEGKVIQDDNQAVCLFLLQIVEQSLYLEQCVSQICGIRPVMGRMDDVSKKTTSLFEVAEQHAFLAAPLKELRPIFALLYPGLLINERIIFLT